MAELQRVAARDGGSGLVPFLARAGASGTGSSQGHSSQDGVSGGESVQQGDSSSAGTSASDATSEGIHRTALITPDELARLFDRATMLQVVIINGSSLAMNRTNFITK